MSKHAHRGGAAPAAVVVVATVATLRAFAFVRRELLGGVDDDGDALDAEGVAGGAAGLEEVCVQQHPEVLTRRDAVRAARDEVNARALRVARAAVAARVRRARRNGQEPCRRRRDFVAFFFARGEWIGARQDTSG